jgi:pimeloyl-ACP methyl ester carboxylesterase
MLRAKVNGLSVAYERTGDGPALVLLHGFAVDSRMWRPQIESLSDKFRSSRGTHLARVSRPTPQKRSG